MKAENFVVVLVEPQHQGNVGSAARAMKNCGLSKLRIVRGVRLGKEAKNLAVHAGDLLKNAKRFPNLRSAIADTTRIVGFTSKLRRFGPPSRNLREFAPTLREASKKNRVALVFGREDHGLLDAEISLCTDLIKIPAAPAWPVFNLAQAVLLASHEIAVNSKSVRVTKVNQAVSSLARTDREKLLEQFAKLLSELNYVSPAKHNRSARILARLSAQFDRALLDQEDLNLWFGLLSRLKQRV